MFQRRLCTIRVDFRFCPNAFGLSGTIVRCWFPSCWKQDNNRCRQALVHFDPLVVSPYPIYFQAWGASEPNECNTATGIIRSLFFFAPTRQNVNGCRRQVSFVFSVCWWHRGASFSQTALWFVRMREYHVMGVPGVVRCASCVVRCAAVLPRF